MLVALLYLATSHKNLDPMQPALLVGNVVCFLVSAGALRVSHILKHYENQLQQLESSVAALSPAKRRLEPADVEHELMVLAIEAMALAREQPMSCAEFRKKASARVHQCLRSIHAAEFDAIWGRFANVSHEPESAGTQAYLDECSYWLHLWAAKTSQGNINPDTVVWISPQKNFGEAEDVQPGPETV